MKHAIVWDLDGTLLDTAADLAAAGNAARAALGLPALPVPEVAAKVGHGLKNLLGALVPGAAENPEIFTTAHAAFDAYYLIHCTDQTRPYPGIVTVLDALVGHPMAIVTNKPAVYTQEILKRLKLSQYFSSVRAGESPHKPDPTSVLAALKDLKAEPATAWMVGDHNTDLGAGTRAGMRTCFCEWGIGSRGEHLSTATATQALDLVKILA
jgi:phosphoglycolate phosphatase